MKRAGLAIFLFASSALAQEPMCATGKRTEQILENLNDRAAHEPRARAKTLASVPALSDGMFFMTPDNAIAPGMNSNDLVGKTIELVPGDATHYTFHQVDYSYIEPAGAALRDFSKTASVHFVKYDLQSASLMLFGQATTSLYLSAFNGIHLLAPADVTGQQVDTLHAFTVSDAIISPLLITTAKPSRLAYPKVYVDERSDSVVVTWRSESGEIFGYDVQARLFRDGRIDFSYKSTRNMRWGTPIVSPGLTNASLRESSLAIDLDEPNDVITPSNAALRPMLDITRVDVSRLNDSEMLRVRVKLNGTIDPSKLASSEFLRYIVVIGSTSSVFLDIRPDGTWQFAPVASNFIQNDTGAKFSGDTIDFYIAQSTLPATSGNIAVQVITRVGANTTRDSAIAFFQLLSAPHLFPVDFSAAAEGSSLELPIAEPFTLPNLNPSAVWTALKAKYPVTDNDIDGIAVYQTFYTDIIFYAGAYSANGNPQVDGIALPSLTYGSSAAKRANVMHMNTLGYGWNATDELSAHVIMHEFGHRWLYFTRIKEGDAITSSLNPVSAHPAQYIHTPAAFRVHNDYDASVMGGGVFTANADGSFHVRDANFGYSWTDLYLMGFAAPEEVPPWFYVAKSDPALGLEYYPPDNIDVRGERHDVTVDQIIAAQGPRKPAMAASPKVFRVLFVLVADEGVPVAVEQVAAMRKIRQLFESNFKTATGGRAEVRTEFSLPGPRRRGASH